MRRRNSAGSVVWVCGDEGVDAASIVFEETAVAFARWTATICSGFRTHLEQSLHTIVRRRGLLAENFRDFAGNVAAGQIHLPQAILGGNVALRSEEIVEIGGLDVGNSVFIAADGDLGR